MSVPDSTNNLMASITTGLRDIEQNFEAPEQLKFELVATDRRVRRAVVSLVRSVAKSMETEGERT